MNNGAAQETVTKTTPRIIHEPQVYVAGRQKVDRGEIDRFLEDHGMTWEGVRWDAVTWENVSTVATTPRVSSRSSIQASCVAWPGVPGTRGPNPTCWRTSASAASPSKIGRPGPRREE